MQSKPNFLSLSSRNALFVALAAMMAIVALILAGCSTTSSTNSDAKSSQGTQKASEKRVVALDWRYEEILYALGVQPVGIVEIGKSKEPQTLKGKLGDATSVGQAKQPNLEVIQSLEPDLILASPTRQAGIMEQLKNIAPTEAYQDTSYIDVLDSMDSIAKILGKEDKAAEVRSRIESKIGEAKNKVEPGTRTALIGWSKNTLYTWVKESFPGSLLTAAGYDYGFDGQKSAIESKTDVAELTGDKLPEMKLDVMYLYNDIEGFRASPYAGVVRNIVDVEQDTWSRSRGPLAAEAMLDQIINS